MNNDNSVQSWEITLPDGTHILDEVEYGYALTVMGVQLVARRNRRTVCHPDGEIDVVAVPENYERNREDLTRLCEEWRVAEEVYSRRAARREELYALYKSWIFEHLDGKGLSSLLFAAAGAGESGGIQ